MEREGIRSYLYYIINKEMETPDLFEHPELIPAEVQEVLNRYSEEDQTYDTCRAMLAEVEALGYTFDYYLDAVPFDLKKI